MTKALHSRPRLGKLSNVTFYKPKIGEELKIYSKQQYGTYLQGYNACIEQWVKEPIISNGSSEPQGTYPNQIKWNSQF